MTSDHNDVERGVAFVPLGFCVHSTTPAANADQFCGASLPKVSRGIESGRSGRGKSVRLPDDWSRALEGSMVFDGTEMTCPGEMIFGVQPNPAWPFRGQVLFVARCWTMFVWIRCPRLQDDSAECALMKAAQRFVAAGHSIDHATVLWPSRLRPPVFGTQIRRRLDVTVHRI